MPRRATGYGGKARNLAALARAGFPVPAAFALPGSACDEFLASILAVPDQPSSLLAEGSVAPDRLARIAERVREAPLSDALSHALSDAFVALQRDGATAVAVRSSSIREDQDEASAAGLHETVLNVQSEAALFDAVRACWASLFSPRVLSYLRSTSDEPGAAVGIVIQAMVPAEVAGVMFTVNPLTGDAGELVLNAAWGLGSAVVDGTVSPDTFRIDKATGGPRDRVIGDKAERTVAGDGPGVVREPVPEADRRRLCLDEATVDELVRLGLRIEEHFDGPRDVEWAVANGHVYVLQARPVTAALQPATRKWQRRRGRERAKIVWSNVNVGEALPGVATPLTWSVLSSFSELGFRRAFGSLGCTVPKDAELVGDFRGRIYLNLTEFMEILSQVPGLRPRTILSLGGGGEVDRLEDDLEGRSSMGFLARLPLTAARFMRENYQVTERVEAFEAFFEDERQRVLSIDPRLLPPSGLARMLKDVERLLDETGALMLTAYGNLLASVVLLTTALRIVAGDRAEVLQRDLLTGLADLDSAAPGLRLWHIAEMAREDGPARDRILEADPKRLRVEDLPSGPTRRALTNFLKAYGHRGAREAEIAEPRWGEDATLLFATLQIHLRRTGGVRPIDVERRQREVRDTAMAHLERSLPAPTRAASRHLLALVQRFLRLRERLRGYVVEVLGMFRRVALDASRRIQVSEPKAGADAAFFLTVDELYAVLGGQLSRVATRVQQRRRQHARGTCRSRTLRTPSSASRRRSRRRRRTWTRFMGSRPAPDEWKASRACSPRPPTQRTSAAARSSSPPARTSVGRRCSSSPVRS